MNFSLRQGEVRRIHIQSSFELVNEILKPKIWFKFSKLERYAQRSQLQVRILQSALLLQQKA
ncbi:MAG: hypothetical protein RMZ69_24265 [Nostoc sp. ChiQUE01a]|nr:hypothetical protein [Nostoc sp. ChiQUE01a]